MPLTRIDDALRRIRRGEMVLVVDDEDRENEGDLTLAAEWVTPEAINFMLRWARGLVCMPCDSARLEELEIGPMVAPGAAGLRHRVHGVDRPPQRGERDRRGRPRAHDPQAARCRCAARALRASRPRVPAARPPRRRARTARSHRGRRRPGPARRARARRGDLRGAARRRFAGALPVSRDVRPGAPDRDDLGRPARRAPQRRRRARRRPSSRPLLL